MSNDLMNVEYQLEGGAVLTADTVRKYLVNGNGNVTDQEVLMFVELCKAQKLNPFTREAYLIKYSDKYPANIVVGKDVFVKRAYNNPNYEGMKAGVVVVNPKGETINREGSIKIQGETLIGGWCEVYVKGFKYPVKSIVSMDEYAKDQSTWKSMPCVMIRKCAIVTALREAFPEDLQGLYDASEMKNVQDKLPEKNIEYGKATNVQKKTILNIATEVNLCEKGAKDDGGLDKLKEFCESNGYELNDLSYEEADELIGVLYRYKEKININTEDIIEAEFIALDESEISQSNEQVKMEV